jgi:hypothetical protein
MKERARFHAQVKMLMREHSSTSPFSGPDYARFPGDTN